MGEKIDIFEANIFKHAHPIPLSYHVNILDLHPNFSTCHSTFPYFFHTSLFHATRSLPVVSYFSSHVSSHQPRPRVAGGSIQSGDH